MKKSAWLPLIVVVFGGCVHTVTEYSGELTESATVIDLVYSPATHGSGVSPKFDMDGSIGLELTSVSTSEKYAVVFRCQHGKFIIDGASAKGLWERLDKDQEVTVHYREVYRVKYDGDEVVSRELIDYDFLDAR